MSNDTNQTQKAACNTSPLEHACWATHDGKEAEDRGQRGRFTLLCCASRHVMLWQQISPQPVLQDLKNAPQVLPDWASSLTRWLKACKSWLPVIGQSQRQQQACKSPLNQVDGGNKRQDTSTATLQVSQVCCQLLVNSQGSTAALWSLS